jgi:hypothetical protein
MNNGLANLVIGTSSHDAGVLVTHLVRGVEFGKILITYENGSPTRVERTESIKVGTVAGNVVRLV